MISKNLPVADNWIDEDDDMTLPQYQCIKTFSFKTPYCFYKQVSQIGVTNNTKMSLQIVTFHLSNVSEVNKTWGVGEKMI